MRLGQPGSDDWLADEAVSPSTRYGHGIFDISDTKRPEGPTLVGVVAGLRMARNWELESFGILKRRLGQDD